MSMILTLAALVVGQGQPGRVLVKGKLVAPQLLKAGSRAPDFRAVTADGRTVTLSSLKGKVVILDFWAVWCKPCMLSMPGLQKIYRQAKPQGVVVLSVNTWDEKPKFAKWVKATKYDFTFVRDPAEGDHDAIRAASIARRLYKVPGIPTMYVIDREGKVVEGLIGAYQEAGLVKALAKVGVRAKA
ncbi:TlpA family protein disulfide reductase [bacterium]|nr:MAG: TlpA family protein disulfide reductase [bacterium]